MILIIKNINIEGPGTLGSFLMDQGFQLEMIELSDGGILPKDLSAFEAVICLGGPMNVYEQDIYPFLQEETLLIQDVLQKQIPFLGLCLGSQLLAKAGGAQVVKAQNEEMGFSSVDLNEQGINDPLFNGCPSTIPVFQWHADTFFLPESATLLASSKVCFHQAFRLGPVAYGLQFHIEITENSIKKWNQAYIKEEQLRIQQSEKMRCDYQKINESFHQVADQIYQNFIKMIKK